MKNITRSTSPVTTENTCRYVLPQINTLSCQRRDRFKSMMYVLYGLRKTPVGLKQHLTVKYQACSLTVAVIELHWSEDYISQPAKNFY